MTKVGNRKPRHPRGEATTTGGERARKPKITPAIESVKAALPFLDYWGRKGAVDPKELFKLSLPVFKLFFPMLTSHTNEDETDRAYWVAWRDLESAANHLAETQRECAGMLNHLVDGNPQYLKCQWIDDALDAFRFHLGGILPIKLEAGTLPTSEPKAGLPAGCNLPGFRANLVRAILEAFRDGASYFAKCPRCQRLFFKTRDDRIYDRLLCAKEYTRKKKIRIFFDISTVFPL